MTLAIMQAQTNSETVDSIVNKNTKNIRISWKKFW